MKDTPQDNYDISKLKKKKRKNSRAKGSTFERDIAKILNEKLETTEFARSPGSGAFATTHTLPDHLKIHGDLITPKQFRFCIECKKGYNKENLYSLFNHSSQFWKFIEQSERDAEKSGKDPLVIFKQDRQPTLAVTYSYIIRGLINNAITIVHKETNKEYSIFLFDDLINLDKQIFE